MNRNLFYNNPRSRAKEKIDDGQLAFLCVDRQRWHRRYREHWICPIETSIKALRGGFKLEFQTFQLTRLMEIKFKHKYFLSQVLQSANTEIPSDVTSRIVFHMWIIYIGEGCIYSPFLITHPQPLRSYLENASQYTGFKPSTTTNHMYMFHPSTFSLTPHSTLGYRNHHNLS